MQNLKFIIVFVLIILLFVSCNNKRNISPVAKNGIIDLTKWDFEKDGIVLLDGKWEFYWSKFLNENHLKDKQNNLIPQFIKVPSLWNNMLIDGNKISGEGYASYRLLIKTNKVDSVLRLKINRIDVAYKLFVNGKNLVNVGEISDNGNTKPYWKVVSCSFNTSDTNEIIIQISNNNHRKGGISNSIAIGNNEQIKQYEKNKLGVDFFLLGLLVIMGIHYISIFILRQKEVPTLYFGLLCLFVALHMSVSSELSLVILFPNIDWELVLKANFWGNFFRISALNLFIGSLLTNEISTKFTKGVAIWAILMSIFVLFTKAIVFSHVLFLFIIVTIVSFIYLLYGIIVATINKREGAVFSLIGMLSIVIIGINDILHDLNIINTMFLIPIGLFIFIFLQSVMVSYRFAMSFKRSEELMEKLNYTNKNLENIVKERTEEIELQKKELVSKSNNLTKTNNKLKNQANEILQKNEILGEQQEELSQVVEELRVLNDVIESTNLDLNTKNQEFVKQRDIANNQKNMIETQNKSIKESILYAKRIQSALLDSTFDTYESIENFVYFQPKDIVSGDFYWIKKIDKYLIFTVVDCTGHGVPGGFMSMLGIAFLNEIVPKTIRSGFFSKNRKINPGLILHKLRNKVKSSLHQNKDSNSLRDGMDMALCIFNTESKIMHFSGAYNPLIVIKNINNKQELIEIKGDRMPIGIYVGKEKSFTNHRIKLETNDTVYIYSDGFVDQIGGKNKRKYLSKNFKNLLMKISSYPIDMQKQLIQKEYDNWILKDNNKDKHQQIDDILIMGFKIK